LVFSRRRWLTCTTTYYNSTRSMNRTKHKPNRGCPFGKGSKGFSECTNMVSPRPDINRISTKKSTHICTLVSETYGVHDESTHSSSFRQTPNSV
jgi:hypothetical protein